MCEVVAVLIGTLLALAVLVLGPVALVAARRVRREFRAHEVEITRCNADLDERNRNGCRRTRGRI